MPPSAPKNLVGLTLAGRYRIERPIGEGGMGAVYLATQLSLGRNVAIKVLKTDGVLEADAVRRFQRETDVISRLQHPNIVQVVDAGSADDGTLFIAMEHLDGETVRAVLRRGGPISVLRALAVAGDVCRALLAAHKAGVVHRDLKAENVMLQRVEGLGERAKVLDFGVAKLTAATAAPPVTGEGLVAGTPGSIAPEQLLGKSDDPRSDLYALGVLLFEMISGEPPYVSNNSMELMVRTLTDPVPSLRERMEPLGRSVPGVIDSFVGNLLEKDPDLRPKNAEDLLATIERLEEAGEVTQPDNRTPSGPSRVVVIPPQAPQTLDTPHASSVQAVRAASEARVPTALPLPLGRRRWQTAAIASAVLILVALGFGLRARGGGLHLSSDPEARAAIERAIDAWWRLQLDAATANARDAVARDPDAAIGWLLLGTISIVEDEPFGRIDASLSNARQAAERGPSGSFPSERTRALVRAVASPDYHDAVVRFTAFEERFGVDPFARQLLATRLSLAYGNPERLDRFEMVNIQPPRPVTLLGLARRHLEAGRTAEARATLASAPPRAAAVVHALVDIDLFEGKLDDAIARLERHVAEDAGFVTTWVRLAALRARRGDADAMSGVRAFIERLPAGDKRVDATVLVGHALAALGRLEEADQAWEDAYRQAGAAGPLTHTRALEIASMASMFAHINHQPALAAKWADRVRERRDLLEMSDVFAQRMHVLSLVADVLGAAYAPDHDPRLAEQKLQALAEKPFDVPVVKDAAEVHLLMRARRFQDAEAVIKRLPPCFAVPDTVLLAVETNDTARARAQLAPLAKLAPACTAGTDTLAQMWTVLFAEATALVAALAADAGDLDQAAQARALFRGIWRDADATLPSVRRIVEVERRLGLSDPQ
ncbi:MAG: DUF2890 domain-containing protein [Deltaproteobacteria bacterium]|nr:DUF2890 domain-containing protein [Deltaproteobacteria bacterium]